MDPEEKKEIIDAITNSHQTVFMTFQKLFDNSIKSFSEELAQFEERNSRQHHEIIAHQEKTNGRIMILENETRVFRWAHRNPKTALLISVLLLAGVIALGIFLGIDNLVKII